VVVLRYRHLVAIRVVVDPYMFILLYENNCYLSKLNVLQIQAWGGVYPVWFLFPLRIKWSQYTKS